MILLNKTLQNIHHIVKIALSHNRHESFIFCCTLVADFLHHSYAVCCFDVKKETFGLSSSQMTFKHHRILG
jgi:hypothetical protein